MASSSVASHFKFESYKVDYLTLKAAKSKHLLAFKGYIPEEEWNFDISLRAPMFFKNDRNYVCGLNLSLFLLNETGKKQQEENSDISEENVILSIESGIGGIFKATEGQFDKDTEEKLVKIQGPALLLPYLRGAITSLLANAGFGTMLFPLINIHELAKTSLAGMDIEIRD